MREVEAIEILEEVKELDDSMYQFNPKYMEALDVVLSITRNLHNFMRGLWEEHFIGEETYTSIEVYNMIDKEVFEKGEQPMKEIVIKISDADYTHIIKSKWYYEASYEENPTDLAIRLGLATAKGKVLPKGHGRLIDADAFIDTLDASDRDIYCEQAINEDAPTLVEADKGDPE